MPFDINPDRLPRPYDLRQVEIGFENLANPWREQAAPQIVPVGPVRSLLASVFGNSPYLTQCLIKEVATLGKVITDGPDAVFNNLLNELGYLGRGAESVEAEIMQQLRIAKRRAAMIIGLADIAGTWPLEIVTQALSDFADIVVQVAVRHLLRAGEAAGEIEISNKENPEWGSGLAVLGLGKLGARELNYSSDIDLIILFDRERVRYRGRRSAQEFFVRLARGLVKLLQDSTVDGYVHRVDLRLRPDPASTPLALSTIAAETYYEGMGQNWERAAMIKARPIAGDLDVGHQFLRNLRPYIWRKHLDFAAIEDIHSIKRQIHAVKGHREIAVAGHNIKIGRGGIREIEFFAQTQQLIWGGRIPELRLSQTCAAIEALVALGRTERAAANDLVAAYRYLRHVEHRLQMIDDQQTQTLPEGGADLDRLALFCGHADLAEFSVTLLHHLGQVEDHYADLFEESPSLGEQGNLVFTGTEDDPETVATLQRMGFPDGHFVSAQVRAWHHGRYRATRSARARELLTELMPKLLEALAKTADPDMAFRRFDAFLRALPAGVQVFALLYSNPGLLELLADVMGSAPLLADHLSRYPMLLDGVLTAGFFEKVADRSAMQADLTRQLGYAGDLQDRLALLCRWAKDRQFQICVRLLRGAEDGDQAGDEMSDVGEAVLSALHPIVTAEFEQRHGKLPGRGMSILAMGKLGSREMTITSDLDLTFIYDVPEDVENWDTLPSDGPKPLPPIQYFGRLAQRFITALTAQSGDGKLYEVDMRLRPSGNAGPIASGLAPFERYQRQDAWTWEHMALTRARPITGDQSFMREIQASLASILTLPRDPEKLRRDVLDMRARIQQQFRGDRKWDLKYRRGGQVDIDFIAQYLMLRHGHEHPAIIAHNPGTALRAMQAAGILSRKVADRLITTASLWRRLQQMSRLLVSEKIDEQKLSEPTRRHLASVAGCQSFEELEKLVDLAAVAVYSDFASIFATED